MSKQTRAMQRRKISKGGSTGGSRVWIYVVVIVVVLGAALIAISRGSGSSDSSAARKPASDSLVKQVTSVPASTVEAVGAGTANKLPQPVNGTALTANGKPLVLYFGAEYCPYCATERWALVNALSRFGTFSNLQLTTSSASDVFPSTNTFSFYGSKYTSDYITFQGVETATNSIGSDGQYSALDKPTAEQQAIVAKDNPNGTIPFINIGGKYVISGASYDASVLQGKSWNEIAGSLSDPKNAITQGAIGTANGITAAICSVTGNKPSNVCDNATIKGLQTKINAGGTQGSGPGSTDSSAG